jgi:hypothetical protein
MIRLMPVYFSCTIGYVDPGEGRYLCMYDEIRWRKIDNQYHCARVLPDGTEVVNCTGTMEEVVRYLKANGFSHVNAAMLCADIENLCE